jgi:hypothetical protein
MKRFMAIYTGTAEATERTGWSKLDPAAREERAGRGMAAWADWMARNADSIVDRGAPLGKTMRASSAGISSAGNNLTAYVIIEAESHEEAARLFEEHPHFSIFPGDSVDIMEILPIPESPG